MRDRVTLALSPRPDYVDQCRSAIWIRRGWTAWLMSIGAALSVALLLSSRERVDDRAAPQ